MSAKNRDNKNRWRNITVGFRVSPEENELINRAVALSGLPKQEYCYRRCLNQDVVVQGNPRVYKALKTEFATVLAELKRIEAGKGVDDELLSVRVMFRHPLYPFMLADVDFFVRMPDGTFAILECKTCNYNAKDKWADEGIPAHYVLQVRHYLSVMNMQKAFIACLYGNNENEFVYRTIERDLIEEEDIIDQETYFWQEHVLKNVVPPHNGNSDLVLANIRNYGGFADKSIPEIVLSGLESKNLEKYLTLSEEKSQLEKRKKEIEAEQRAISVPFVEQLGQGCKAVLEDGTNRYRITYNPTRRTSVGKDQMEKLKNQHPDIYEEYTKTTESRTFRIKKEAA